MSEALFRGPVVNVCRTFENATMSDVERLRDRAAEAELSGLIIPYRNSMPVAKILSAHRVRQVLGHYGITLNQSQATALGDEIDVNLPASADDLIEDFSLFPYAVTR